MFSGWLTEFVSRQGDPDPVIVHCEKSLEQLRELASSLPAVVECEIVSVDAFTLELNELREMHRAAEEPDQRSFQMVQRAYWHDQARLALAYRDMVLLRSTEFVLSAVPLLNRRELLGPAVLARAGLELAALHAIDSHKLVELFNAAPSVAQGHHFVMKDSGGNVWDPERILIRALWGWKADRGTEHTQPPELRQLNALTAITKLAKIVPKIEDVYDYLCQVAHPNVAGNARFWAKVQDGTAGRSTLRYGRRSEGPEAERIRGAVLWALGWSAATVCQFSRKLSDAARGLHRRWPQES